MQPCLEVFTWDVGGAEGAVDCPCHPTVRLNCFRYFAGVMPVRPLKMCVK